MKPLDPQLPAAGHVVVADDQDLYAPGRHPYPIPGVVRNPAAHRKVADADQGFIWVDAELPSGPERRIQFVDAQEGTILVLDDVGVPQVQIRPDLDRFFDRIEAAGTVSCRRFLYWQETS